MESSLTPAGVSRTGRRAERVGQAAGRFPHAAIVAPGGLPVRPGLRQPGRDQAVGELPPLDVDPPPLGDVPERLVGECLEDPPRLPPHGRDREQGRAALAVPSRSRPCQDHQRHDDQGPGDDPARLDGPAVPVGVRLDDPPLVLGIDHRVVRDQDQRRDGGRLQVPLVVPDAAVVDRQPPRRRARSDNGAG